MHLVWLAIRLLRTATKAVLRPRDLALENIALRQQLASVCHQSHPRPKQSDRIFWSILSRVWSSWKQRSVSYTLILLLAGIALVFVFFGGSNPCLGKVDHLSVQNFGN
jgi:hypothetical protein